MTTETPNQESQAIVFEHRSVIPTTMARMKAFHQDPKALNILTPPPIFVQVHRDERTSLTSGELEFTLWFGPLPVRWLARHEQGANEHSFMEWQVSGPAQSWRHEHTFNEVEGGVELIDRVTYSHRPSGFWSLFTRANFSPLPMKILFTYRHWRTRLATTGDTAQSAAQTE